MEKAPLTPDNTYSQYAEGVPPPEPTPRPLDQEDEDAIEAVVGEQPSPGPGPEEREDLARQHLQGAGEQDSAGDVGQTTGEKPPTEPQEGTSTTWSEEDSDAMQGTQEGRMTLGKLTSKRDIGADDPGNQPRG